jgi:hypothetical protein
VSEDEVPAQEKTSFAGGVIEDDDWETSEDSSNPDEDEDEDDEDSLALGKFVEKEYRLPVAREDLLKVGVKLGHTKMTGIIDSGAQISIISQALAEASGLPWLRGRQHHVRLVSVDGTISKCVGKIQGATILLTPGNVPSYGDIYVAPRCGFDLLLGRTWGTLNQITLNEETTGTILYLTNKFGERVKINVCPISGKQKRMLQRMEERRWARHQYPPAIRAYSARIEKVDEEEGEILEVTDSEPERREEEESGIAEISTEGVRDCEADFEYSPISIESQDPPTPAQRPREGAIEDDDTRLWSETEDRAENNTRRKDTAAVSKEGSGEESDGDTTGPTERFKISNQVYESYIKMIQDGVSNEEWNAFSNAEERNIRRDEQHWKNMWDEDSDDTGALGPATWSESGEEKEETKLQEPEIEPSQTLATPDENPIPNPTTVPNPTRAQTKVLRRNHTSEISAGRRTKRTRRLTERAKGDEYRKLMKRYERKERQTRKTVWSKGAPITKSDMFAGMARMLPPEEATSEEEKEERTCSDRYVTANLGTKTWEEICEWRTREEEKENELTNKEGWSTPGSESDGKDEGGSENCGGSENGEVETCERESVGESPNKGEPNKSRFSDTSDDDYKERTYSDETEREVDTLQQTRSLDDDLKEKKDQPTRGKRFASENDIYYPIPNHGDCHVEQKTAERPRKKDPVRWQGSSNKGMGNYDGMENCLRDTWTWSYDEVGPMGIGTRMRERMVRGKWKEDGGSEADSEGETEREESEESELSGGSSYEWETALEDLPDLDIGDVALEEIIKENRMELTGTMNNVAERPNLTQKKHRGLEKTCQEQWRGHKTDSTRAYNEFSNIRNTSRKEDNNEKLTLETGKDKGGGERSTEMVDEKEEEEAEPIVIDPIMSREETRKKFLTRDTGEKCRPSIDGQDPPPGREFQDRVERLWDENRRSEGGSLEAAYARNHDTQTKSRSWADSDEEDNICLGGLIPADPFAKIDRNGIMYLPRPSAVGNGVLACRKVQLFAENDNRGQYYFLVQGVTLAMETEDGRPVYYSGDATVRIDKPCGQRPIYVAQRDRTNDARNNIFRKKADNWSGAHVPENRSRLPTTSPQGNQMRWYTLTKKELNAVLDDLSGDPMESGEVERTYTIERMKNGMVRVRPGLQLGVEGAEPSTQDHDPGTPKGKKKDVSKTDEGTDLDEQRILTGLGSDPHPAGERMDRESELEATGGDAKDSKTSGNYEETPENLEKSQNENIGRTQSIKTVQLTTEESPSHNRPPAQISLTPVTTAPTLNGECSCGCQQCPGLNRSTPQPENEPVPEVSVAPQPEIQDVPSSSDNVPLKEGELDITVRPPDRPRPGWLTMTHMVPLTEDTLPPGEHSFYGFGATVVAADNRRCASVHRGQVYLHLFDSSLDEEGSGLEQGPTPPDLEGLAGLHQIIIPSELMEPYLHAIVPRADTRSPFFGENPTGDGLVSSVQEPTLGLDCKKVNEGEGSDEEWLEGARKVFEKAWEKMRAEAGGPTNEDLQMEQRAEEQHIRC